MEYINEKYRGQGIELLPTDADEKMRYRLAALNLGKFVSEYFHLFMHKGEDKSKLEDFVRKVNEFEDWFAGHTETQFIMGTDHPTLLDIDAAPILFWIEALEGTKLHFVMEALDYQNKLPKLKGWLAAMRAYPAFATVIPKKEALQGYLNDHFAYPDGKLQLYLPVKNL
eukprot:NODE_2818_length_861_cov_85.033251_g2330_i0.p1 GENE.NODE_2818_length_861_cov_85.033251_g2330_i0~~NODE_2818_length_861_cov_85.033251_g2330_i0.p1  ORF type:complete len:169 (-),score=37.82 NODE_2818_length_861_cov_85.033251_g2330_i0:39-545(-)